jgi:hypothetical protein
MAATEEQPVVDSRFVSLVNAIRSVESGGKTNALSPQGASGSMQIMPATFKQYARPGESFDNDEHRTNAAIRKIQDDYKYFGGDLEKTAAAYLGGRGAIRDGQIRDDVKDALGTTPAAYARRVLARLDMKAIPPRTIAAPPVVREVVAEAPATPVVPKTDFVNEMFTPQKSAVKMPALDDIMKLFQPTVKPDATPRGPDIGVDDQNRLYVNGIMIDSTDHGKAIQAFREGAFAAPGKGVLPNGFRQPNPGEVESYFESIVPSSATGKSFRAGIENYKAGWNEIIGAAQTLMGTPDAQNTGMQAANINKRYSGQLGDLNPLPQTLDSAQGVGGVAQLTWGKIVESAPFMAELVGSGVAGTLLKLAALRGLPTAAKAAAQAAGEAALTKGMSQEAAAKAAQKVSEEFLSLGTRYAPQIAMMAGGYGSAVGDILGNQREEAGAYNTPAAAALAVPYSALNLIGGGAQAVNLLTRGAVRGTIGNEARGVGGRLARGASGAVWTGLEEATGETGQEVLNQMGRMAVNPNASLTSPDALHRYREAAAIGGLTGAAIGGTAGVMTRAQQPVDMLKPATPAPPAPPAPAVDQTVRVDIPPTASIPPHLVEPGIHQPSMAPGARVPLSVPEGIMNTQGTADLVGGAQPRPNMGTEVQAPSAAQPVELTPGATLPQQTNMLGERYTPGAPAIDAGPTQTTVDALPADAVVAKPRAGTTSVLRRRPPRGSLKPDDGAGAPILGGNVPTTGEAAPVTVKPKTRGEILKERAAAKQEQVGESGTVELVPKRRVRGVESASVDPSIKGRASPYTAAPAQPAEVTPAPEATAPAAAVPKTPSQPAKAGAQPEPKAAPKAAAAEPVTTVTSEPTDEEIAADEKKIESLFAVARKRREKPKEPSGREQKKASADTKTSKQLHEEVLEDGELTENALRVKKLGQDLGGFSRWAGKKKGVKIEDRARSRGGIDRIAEAARERATRLEAINTKFDEMVEKHGVAAVNAMFEYRKKNNLEMTSTAEEIDEETGEIEESADRKQVDANVTLSNLWRLYRAGHYDTNKFGFTRFGEGQIRSREEEGSNSQNLKAWFSGERRTKQGQPINGMKALAYYMRMHGRTDLERLLGGALYKIFKNNDSKIDFLVLKSPPTGKLLINDNRAVEGAFLTSGTVIHQGGTVRITKPTLVIADGTLEDVFAHEMVHAAVAQLVAAKPELQAKFSQIIKAMKNAGLSNDENVAAIADQIASEEDPRVAANELLAYGMTHPGFQDYLKTIPMEKPRGGSVRAAIENAFQFFVNLVKLAIGAHGAKYTAMARLIEEGARVFEVAQKTKPGATKITLGARSPFSEAGFKHKTTNEIIGTGPTHLIRRLPEDAVAGDWESGFITHDGKFFNREDAAKRVGLEEVGDLHTGDLEEAGLSLGHAGDVRLPTASAESTQEAWNRLWATVKPLEQAALSGEKPNSVHNDIRIMSLGIRSIFRGWKENEAGVVAGLKEGWVSPEKAARIRENTAKSAAVYARKIAALQERADAVLNEIPTLTDDLPPLAHAAFTPQTAVPYGDLAKPSSIVEKTFRAVIETALPFMYKTTAEGKTKFEAWYEKYAAEARDKIIENHPTISRIAAGVIDKFGLPERFRGLLDMGRKKVHNAAQESFAFWEGMRGFDEKQQKFVHLYIESDGAMLANSFPGYDKLSSKEQEDLKTLLANLNTTLKNIVERAVAQGVLPEGLKEANFTELVRWIDKNTARLSFGLKMSASDRPKGIHQTAKDEAILGDAEAYHRGEVVNEWNTPEEPDYVFVPVGANLAEKEAEIGKKIKLDTDHTFRVVKKSEGRKKLWAAYTYTEGMRKMKATNYTDALVYTMHNLLHDIAASEFANEVVSTSDVSGDNPMVFKDKEDAIDYLNKVGKGDNAYRVIEDVDHPEKKLLARTPGYWVKLGSGYGKLSHHYVPATMYSAITDVQDKSPFFPEYKTLLNFWKKTKTAYSPPTHFNNVMSSFVMAYMNDIPVSTIRKALNVFAYRNGNGKKLWDEFSRSGALIASYSSGEIGTDLARKIDDAIAREHHAESAVGLVRLLSKMEQSKAAAMVGATSDFAIDMYEAEDNIFRLAAYMEFVRREMSRPGGMRGDTLTNAAGKFAADAMINYSIDARYITNLRKTVMPFLAWPYRMVPMLIRTALFKPWKIATMASAVYAINALSYAVTGDDEEEERKKLPEYLRGNLFMMPGAPKTIKLPGSIDGKPLYMNISTFMPLGDFTQESRSGFLGLPWPQALMPGGPIATAAELALGFNSFTGKPLHLPTDTAPEKAGNTLKAAWTAFSPNIPLPFNRQGDKVGDLLRNKHGVTGSEADWGTSILQMVGPKIMAVDQRERTALAGIQIAAVVGEYQRAIRKLAMEEMRYENPDMDKIHEKQARLIADMKDKISKAKGEEGYAK